MRIDSKKLASAARAAGIALAVATSIAGCDKTEEPTPTTPPAKGTASTASAQAASASPTKGDGQLTWDAPAAFKKSDTPNSMRLATYAIPKAAGDADDGELAISTAGGTVEQNARRWVNQFEGAAYDSTKQTKVKAGPYEATVVELEGTFSGMSMPGKSAQGPKPNWAMLAAIVPVGSSSYFFKLTGPSATMKAVRADFDKLVASIKGAP